MEDDEDYEASELRTRKRRRRAASMQIQLWQLVWMLHLEHRFYIFELRAALALQDPMKMDEEAPSEMGRDSFAAYPSVCRVVFVRTAALPPIPLPPRRQCHPDASDSFHKGWPGWVGEMGRDIGQCTR